MYGYLAKVTIRIETESVFEGSGIIADLRNVAEALFHPLRMAGYWDGQSGDHLCPQTTKRLGCPHELPAGDPSHIPYEQTVEDDLKGVLDVSFPHANVWVYLR